MGVPKTVVIACAALHRELRTVLAPFGDDITVELLPANLHNRPERIPAEVETLIVKHRASGVEQIVAAYADCGTGGLLDAVLHRHGVPRLPGAHCYEFFSGTDAFTAMQEEELGTFYLTDFLALHFESLVWAGLGMDRHPELRNLYFSHYQRLTLISQSDNPVIEQKALAAAELLQLRYVRRHTGLEPFTEAVTNLLGSPHSPVVDDGRSRGEEAS
jgi:hypothetical protein